jgi:catalase
MVEGRKVRERGKAFKDFFTQARLFYHSMSEPERKHMISGFHFELGKVDTMEVRKNMMPCCQMLILTSHKRWQRA